MAAKQIRDGLVVTQHLLALERCRLTLHGLQDAILRKAQFGDDRHYGFLVHILLRECTVDGGSHLSGLSLQRVGRHLEIVTCQLS